MNDKQSFIKLHRKFLNWEWYRDTNTKILFIHLLLKANWKDTKFEGQIIKRGSIATSVNSLSDELSTKRHKVSIQSIRTALKHLVSTNEITINATSKYTVITINNYEQYQENNKVFNNQLTNDQQTANNQLTTIEEYKEYKNNKNINIINTTTTSIYEFIEKNFGRILSPIEIKEIELWLSWYEEEIIKHAIKIAIMNNKKTFNYVNGILNNWKTNGYKTLQEIMDETKIKEKKLDKKIELIDYDWLNEMEE